MNSVVTQRFIECHNKVIAERRVRSSRQFAISLDYLPQSLSEILKGRRDVTIELLRKAVEKYQFNPRYLCTGDGPLFSDDESSQIKGQFKVLTVVTDHHGDELIVHVPVSAQAGYGGQLHDPVFLQNLPSFNLPGISNHNESYRCFDVSGDSMEPTLFNAEKIVCNYIEPEAWTSAIKNNHVYVIVTAHDVLVKRVRNKIKESGHLELFSDNSFYSPYVMEASEVKEMWYVKMKISPFMPSPANVRNALHQEIDGLKRNFSDQSKLISNLNLTIEKLLKQNRARI
jgi:hypothetical protein